MFEIAFTNPTDAEITYSAVGVVGHGLRPPTKAGAGQPQGRRRASRSLTDEPDTGSPDYAEIVLATDSAGHAAGRPISIAATGSMRSRSTGRTCIGRDRSPSATTAPATSLAAWAATATRSLVAAHVVVPPGETRTVRFAISWYAPNFRKYWITPVWHFRQPSAAVGQWKNWYATEWTGAETIAAEVLARWDELKRRDASLPRCASIRSTLPVSVLDAAAANLSHPQVADDAAARGRHLLRLGGMPPERRLLRGQLHACVELPAGAALPVPGARALDARGRLQVQPQRRGRPELPPEPAARHQLRDRAALRRRPVRQHPQALPRLEAVAATRRGWRSLWPAAKLSIEYAWSPQNPDRWDPEQTGVLWGRQHHTLDMELFGPNSWLTELLPRRAEGRRGDGRGAGRERYGRALSARSTSAAAPGSTRTCSTANISSRRSSSATARVLRPSSRARWRLGVLGDTVEQLYWSAEHKELKYQLGGGCLIDQALGQWHAGLYGLGDVLDPREGRDQPPVDLPAQLQASGLATSTIPCRVFGMDDESGTRDRHLAG